MIFFQSFEILEEKHPITLEPFFTLYHNYVAPDEDWSDRFNPAVSRIYQKLCPVLIGRFTTREDAIAHHNKIMTFPSQEEKNKTVYFHKFKKISVF